MYYGKIQELLQKRVQNSEAVLYLWVAISYPLLALSRNCGSAYLADG